MPDRGPMVARADEHLLAAQKCLEDKFCNAAYELARTAAELYGKVLLLDKTGDYPRDHNVAGELRHRRLLPPDVSPVELSRFLADYTRGGYDFEQPVEPREARQAIALARRLKSLVEAR